MNDDSWGGYKGLDHLFASLHRRLGWKTKLIIFVCPGKTKYLPDSELVNNGLFHAYYFGWIRPFFCEKCWPWPLDKSR